MSLLAPRQGFYLASKAYAWENKSDGPCSRCGTVHFRDRLWFCQECGAVLCDSQISTKASSYPYHLRKWSKPPVFGECGPVMKLSYEEVADPV